MKGFIVALGFLTRLPLPRLEAGATDFATAIRFYPLAGLVIGMLVVGAGWIGAQLDPWLGALVALAVWTMVTGALHLDGLSDLVDGLGAAHGDRERLFAVMADPHVGNFGVVAIVLQLIAKLLLLHTLVTGGWWAIALVPFAARIGPLFWAALLPPLGSGLAAAVAGAIRPRDLVGWALLLIAAVFLAPGLAIATILIPGWGLWLRQRIGGVTGDCHGAGIELMETGLLFALSAASRL